MDQQKTEKLISYFQQYVTKERFAKIESLLQKRTRHITVVLEDIYQSLNASAILRTCDALGVQDVHCIEDRNPLDIKRNISQGASKWLTLSRYSQEQEEIESPLQHCIETLKKDNYTIVATSPHATMPIEKLPLDNKVALLFGTEQEGLTEQAVDYADQLVKIPMYGFVESFNVSVSVALCLYDLTTRLRVSKSLWQLNSDEQKELMLDWLRNSVDHPDILERKFYEDNK